MSKDEAYITALERAEKAEAELARLTTPQDASTHVDGVRALWWKRSGKWLVPLQVCSYCPSVVCRWWTPLPEPMLSKPKEAHEPQK